MTKALRKAIATRSRLENRYYYRDKTDVSNRAYKKQKNNCNKLYKKERKKYYANLDVNNITDNKTFGGHNETIFFLIRVQEKVG